MPAKNHPPSSLQDQREEALKRAAEIVISRMLEEQRARAEFKAGSTFQLMLDCLRDSSEPLVFTEEDLAYRREETLEYLGWTQFTDDDIRLFVDVLADPQAEGVSGVSSDRDCPFGNCTFEHFGLHVRMLFGQGTAICIWNAAAM